MAAATAPRPPPPPPPLTDSPYPFAGAPDIIRAHQKDAYFQGTLTNQLADLHRRLVGARSAHAWAPETATVADLLYLCLTTLLGNRTLGEEYCDLVQVEAPSGTSSSSSSSSPSAAAAAGPRLPALPRRAAYIASSVLLPYGASRLLPRLRAALRATLEARLAALVRQGRAGTRAHACLAYLHAHLAALTGGAHARAATLALFYFTGAYYTLSKRAARLRYVFTRRPPAAAAGHDRGGYEVLGVLLLVQLALQAWLHVRATMVMMGGGGADGQRERDRLAVPGAVALDENAYSVENEFLLGAADGGGALAARVDLAAATHTPVLAGPRYHLDKESVMGWIKGRQQRKCTLCLEELKDPSATQCGHVFCWACIGDWVREKPECPLCRRDVMVQHILPLRVP